MQRAVVEPEPERSSLALGPASAAGRHGLHVSAVSGPVCPTEGTTELLGGDPALKESPLVSKENHAMQRPRE